MSGCEEWTPEYREKIQKALEQMAESGAFDKDIKESVTLEEAMQELGLTEEDLNDRR